MDFDTDIIEQEFDKFIDNIRYYFEDSFGKEHIAYLADFLLKEAIFYENELEDYE